MVPGSVVRRVLAGALGTVLAVGLLTVPGVTSPVAATSWENVAAAGEHTLVVLPVYWTTPDAQTATSLRALARQTGDYWSEQTNGVVSVPDARITVREWMPIADPVTCDRDAIFYAALAAANERAGSYHKHVIVYFPQTSMCPWQGTASVYPEYEGNIYHQVYGWIWINGYTSPDVWERGFGRNLGLGHARAATCTSAGGQVPLSSSCSTREDADFDVMSTDRGGEGFTLNTALADRIGLLDPASVRTASIGASFTLSPVSAHTGLLAVKVPLPDDTILYVEYRPSVGRDAGQPPGWSGVQVRQRGTWDYSSRLLALTPDGADGLLANAAARTGAGWRIPGTFLELVVDSQDATGAHIRFAALPDTTPPPAPAAPTVTGQAQARGFVRGDLQATWPSVADDDSGIQAYRLFVDDALVSSASSVVRSVNALADGEHRLRVDVVNGAGLTTTGAVTTIRVDATGPTVSVPSIAFGTGSTAAGIPVVITAPADDAGSGIASLTTTVNGRPVASAAPVLAVLPTVGVVTVQVSATDLLGNTTTATRSLAMASVTEKAGRYSRGWTVRRSTAYAGGAAKVTRKRGATAVHTFTGSQVALVGSRGPRAGAATVYLDGRRMATVDTRGPAAQRQVLWASSTTDGRHTLRVVVHAPRRTGIALDSLLSAR